MTPPLRVFLAGEGRSELGSRAGHPVYQSDDQPGVIVALLTKIQPSGWEIGGARMWKSIRKLRVGSAPHADTHNVLGAALDAKEAGCGALAFIRDRDGDDKREQAVEDGIRRARAELGGALEIIGAVAIPKLEGWILALRGHRRTEDMSPGGASAKLAEVLDRKPGLEAMLAVVGAAILETLPHDAKSLAGWLHSARVALPASAAGDD